MLQYKVSVHYYKDGQKIEAPTKKPRFNKKPKDDVMWIPMKPQYVPKGKNAAKHAAYHDEADEYFSL